MVWEDGGGDPASYPIRYKNTGIEKVLAQLKPLAQSMPHGYRTLEIQRVY